MITAKFQGHPVEVIDTYGKESRGTWAIVEYLDGTTHPMYTHGGWAESSTSHVPVSCLHDVQQIDTELYCREQDRHAEVNEMEELRQQL